MLVFKMAETVLLVYRHIVVWFKVRLRPAGARRGGARAASRRARRRTWSWPRTLTRTLKESPRCQTEMTLAIPYTVKLVYLYNKIGLKRY